MGKTMFKRETVKTWTEKIKVKPAAMKNQKNMFLCRFMAAADVSIGTAESCVNGSSSSNAVVLGWTRRT